MNIDDFSLRRVFSPFGHGVTVQHQASHHDVVFLHEPGAGIAFIYSTMSTSMLLATGGTVNVERSYSAELLLQSSFLLARSQSSLRYFCPQANRPLEHCP